MRNKNRQNDEIRTTRKWTKAMKNLAEIGQDNTEKYVAENRDQLKHLQKKIKHS